MHALHVYTQPACSVRKLVADATLAKICAAVLLLVPCPKLLIQLDAQKNEKHIFVEKLFV